jgi:cation transport regulator
MPYTNISELPEDVRDVLPKHAQDIFKAAFNSAYDEYKDPDKRRTDESREAIAFKVAWSAVKNEYEKGTDGTWHPKAK